ncbi:MAG: hypothetical protein LBP50_01750 [Tannerella sp.]|nr:hypothetical protein [Tannerella sp.]
MSVTVNPREVLRMFASLDSKRRKKAHRMALSRGAGILVRETRKNIRIWMKSSGSPSPKSRKPVRKMESGVKSRINRDATEARVHIMGDYRLKWFETGTKDRYRSRKKLYMFRRSPGGRKYWKRNGGKDVRTGKISPQYFFRRARESKESEISANMENLLSAAIRKVYESH